MMKKVLASPSSMGQVGNEPFEILKENGYVIINNPYGRKLTEDEVITLAQGCIGIIAGVEPLTQKVMDQLPDLKCISRVGVGMDNVDVVYANKKGIKVVNTPNGPTRAVAELTLALTFSLLRKIPQAHMALKDKKWEKHIGNLILNKTIGIIGLGRIGKMTAELFKGIGNSVVGFDPYPDKAWAEKAGISIFSFEETLSLADIITLHIPGTSDKIPIIGSKEFDKMKDGAFLINVSRGGVVDEEALFQSLINGKLAAAAIDVFSEEPYTGRLCDLNNVVLTPHLGSYAKEGKLQMEIDAVNNLIYELKNNYDK